MFTFTTYGTWIRGDMRGWIDNGRLMSPDPPLESADRNRMKHPPFTFSPESYYQVGDLILNSLQTRHNLSLFAMTVQSRHIHFIVGPASIQSQTIAKCAKDAVRWGLRLNRPIWTAGYDKRFCLNVPELHSRIRYVQRHNLELSLPANPWPHIEIPPPS